MAPRAPGTGERMLPSGVHPADRRPTSAAATARRRSVRRPRAVPAPAPSPPRFFVPRLNVVAGNLAGRSPPLAS